MKRKTNRLKVILGSAVLLSGIGLCTAAQALTIHVSVNSDETKLEIDTPGNCGSNSNNGCIKANGNSPVTFNLTGNRHCSVDGKWALDRVAIRGSEDGADGDDLPAEAGLDFNVNMRTGVLVDENDDGGNILIRNYNKNVFTVWYRVYATCGGNEIDSDPRMINDGTG